MDDYYVFCRSITQLKNAENFCQRISGARFYYLNYSNSVSNSSELSITFNLKVLIKILINRFFLRKKYALILGDLRWLSKKMKILVFFCDEIWVVDDGLVTLWFYEIYKDKFKFNKKISYFTKYKTLLPDSESIRPNSFCENITYDRREDIAFIFGMSPLHLGISIESYLLALKKLVSHANNSAYKIYYFPHPKELIDWSIENVHIINASGIIEEKIEHLNFIPGRYYSFYSSSMIDCYVIDGHDPTKFHFYKLPDVEKRGKVHGFEFNVEERIYQLFKDLNFTEVK